MHTDVERRGDARTRRVQVDDLQALLDAAPRANLAFRRGDAIEAFPVAFLFGAGRYWIGVPRTAESMLGRGELVKLLIDDGRWFFELRGLWVRGQIAPAERPPEGGSPSLAWFELTPQKLAAWDYGTLRKAADGGS